MEIDINWAKAKHDELVSEYNETEDAERGNQILEDIAVLEMALLMAVDT